MDRTHLRALLESAVMTVLALAALVAMRELGIDAPVPLPVLVGITVTALLFSTGLNTFERARVLPLWVRVGAQVVGVTFVIYTTGWGPVLAVGFVFTAAQAVALEGSAAVRPTAVWSCVSLAAAEIAVQLGWAPDVLGPGRSHGIATLMAAGLLFVLRIIYASASWHPRHSYAVRTGSGGCSSTPPTQSSSSTRRVRPRSPRRRSRR
jgi:hypothetical protein